MKFQHKDDTFIMHITPEGDLKEHDLSTICACEPEVVHESGWMIVVHNSYDGREGVEWVNEILKDDT